MMHSEAPSWKESGVSEVVGFIIIIGLMMTGIALVTLYGYPLLLQEQANANSKNMERNMISLQNDIKSLAYKSVPYKETTLQVSGGTLSVVNGGQSAQKFSIAKNGVTQYPEDPETSLGEIRYKSDSGNEIISLTNGAVIIRFSNSMGSTMIAEPRWYYDASTSTLVIPIIDIQSSNGLSKNGISTVQMKIEQSDPISPPPSINGEDVKIVYRDDTNVDLNFQYDYSTAWKNYMTGSSLNMVGNQSYHGSEYTISGVKTLIIKPYTVTVLNL
jgi:hypothetical protein